MNKTTVVIGASENPERYSYKAVRKLQDHGIEVFAVGIREGSINGIFIHSNKPNLKGIHTVSLYVGPQNQESWIPYILSLSPKRIIFNPGTENADFIQLASSRGIECVEACTLVMLGIGNY